MTYLTLRPTSKSCMIKRPLGFFTVGLFAVGTVHRKKNLTKPNLT